MVQALSALKDTEDRALLAANALAEAEGRQLSIATDAACSRALETLLPAAAPAAVASFARAMADPDNYWELVSRWVDSPLKNRPGRSTNGDMCIYSGRVLCWLPESRGGLEFLLLAGKASLSKRVNLDWCSGHVPSKHASLCF